MVEPVFPEAGHLACPVDQGGQCPELCAVVRSAALMAVPHQPCLLQNAQMFGDRRLRDADSSGQSTDGLLTFAAETFEESPPRRIGERLEERIVRVRHAWIDNRLAIDLYITTALYVSQGEPKQPRTDQTSGDSFHAIDRTGRENNDRGPPASTSARGIGDGSFHSSGARSPGFNTDHACVATPWRNRVHLHPGLWARDRGTGKRS